MALDDLDAAGQALTEAVQLDPEHPGVWGRIALVASKGGRAEEAAAALKVWGAGRGDPGVEARVEECEGALPWWPARGGAPKRLKQSSRYGGRGGRCAGADVWVIPAQDGFIVPRGVQCVPRSSALGQSSSSIILLYPCNSSCSVHLGLQDRTYAPHR